MKFECAHDALVDVHALQPNPKNPNAHPARQIELLAKIISYQGQRSPIVVSNRSGFIVKGHGRLDAVKSLGWAQAAVDYQDYENEAQEYADMIADNKIAELAEHDDNAMIDGIKTLGITDFELLGLDGFSLPEVIEPQCDEDEVPAQVDTRSKLGDVWTLGRHRLMCGDSTSIDAVEKLMNGSLADTVFTSPPYNVGIDYNGHDDKMSPDDYANFMRAVMAAIFIVLKQGRIVAWNVGVSPKSAPHKHVNWLEENGFTLYRNIVWKKTGAQIPLWQNSKKKPLARYYLPNYNHEMIYLVSKGDVEKGAPTTMPEELCMDVWDVSQFAAGGNNHPAAFPVHLAEMALSVLTAKEEHAFEPFGGSGTSVIACEKLHRKCFAMEIDPHYCDVILARWEKYTGQKAERVNG